MNRTSRGLEGQLVGLSVGADEVELARRGFTPAGMNRFTVRLARTLLADGARLAFGHDWRAEGVMEAIASIAIDYQASANVAGAHPVILNLLPWPNELSETDPGLLERLQGIVEVRSAGLPADLAAAPGEVKAGTQEWQYRRARGLTHLRRALATACPYRIACGGKLRAFDGRLPGIVEEVFLSLNAAHPVYLVGLLGGAAEAMGRVLLEGDSPSSLLEGVQLEELYSRREEPSANGLADSDLDRDALGHYLASPDTRERLLRNGLSENENRRLLHSRLEEEVVALATKGLHELVIRARRLVVEGEMGAALADDATVLLESAPSLTGAGEETNRVDALLAMSVEQLDLSVRSANCLKKVRISTLRDLVRKSETEMRESVRLGPTSLAEIKERLSRLGLSLRKEQYPGHSGKGV